VQQKVSTQFIGRLSFETINNNSGQVTQREHKNTLYKLYMFSGNTKAKP